MASKNVKRLTTGNSRSRTRRNATSGGSDRLCPRPDRLANSSAILEFVAKVAGPANRSFSSSRKDGSPSSLACQLVRNHNGATEQILAEKETNMPMRLLMCTMLFATLLTAASAADETYVYEGFDESIAYVQTFKSTLEPTLSVQVSIKFKESGAIWVVAGYVKNTGKGKGRFIKDYFEAQRVKGDKGDQLKLTLQVKKPQPRNRDVGAAIYKTKADIKTAR